MTTWERYERERNIPDTNRHASQSERGEEE
jgi:hypothetical protein